MMNAREIALRALLDCRIKDAWAEASIRNAITLGGCDPKDAALAARIFYTALQNTAEIDYYLGYFIHGRLKNVDPIVLDILRIGAAQAIFLDKIPGSAVVNESVKLTKQYGKGAKAGFVNAVLRKLTAEWKTVPEPSDYETKYNCSSELIQILKHCVPKGQLEPLLIAQNQAPLITARVNTLRISAKQLSECFKSKGIGAELHPVCQDCLILSNTGNLTELDEFRQGLFFVQDPACTLSVAQLEAGPGMRLLDCCSAPGGKSFSAAISMNGEGSIFSCDIYPHKIDLIRAGALRLGLNNISTSVLNASEFKDEFEETFDRIICDVPCSGLGVIRKKPDIRHKNMADIADLPELQLKILSNQARYLKKGGILIYSTCTIVPEENNGVIEKFLLTHSDFHKVPFDIPGIGGNMGDITFYPHIHNMDGFYFCKLMKEW